MGIGEAAVDLAVAGGLALAMLGRLGLSCTSGGHGGRAGRGGRVGPLHFNLPPFRIAHGLGRVGPGRAIEGEDEDEGEDEGETEQGGGWN
jgi:hypothetical protein